MLPLSFKEYVSAFEDKTDISRKFSSYLIFKATRYDIKGKEYLKT